MEIFLPLERELGTQLNMNYSTIMTTYNGLRAIGILESRKLKGYMSK